MMSQRAIIVCLAAIVAPVVGAVSLSASDSGSETRHQQPRHATRTGSHADLTVQNPWSKGQPVVTPPAAGSAPKSAEIRRTTFLSHADLRARTPGAKPTSLTAAEPTRPTHPTRPAVMSIVKAKPSGRLVAPPAKAPVVTPVPVPAQAPVSEEEAAFAVARIPAAPSAPATAVEPPAAQFDAINRPTAQIEQELAEIVRSDRSWIRNQPPTVVEPNYMDDLNDLLRQKEIRDSMQRPGIPVHRVTQSKTTPKRQSGPARIYTDVNTIFTPMSQTMAYDPSDEAMEQPIDSASGLMAASYLPQHYRTQVDTGAPMPNRNVRPFSHNPLYFEDLNLERCGRGNGCATNFGSAVRFFGSTLILPYLMTLDHPHSCKQASPDCPTCAEFPAEDTYPRWSWKAAAVQAGAMAGGFYIVP